MGRRQYSQKELASIFHRSGGKCHLCLEPLVFEAYGRTDHPGGWEVDHSRPVAAGGSDHHNNLCPAHPSCNRSKGTRSSRSVRAENGFARPPLSTEQREQAVRDNTFGGGLVGWLASAGLGFGPVGVLGAVLVGAELGSRIDPDQQS